MASGTGAWASHAARPEAVDHPFFAARRAMQEEAMAALEAAWGEPVRQIPLQDSEVAGLAAVRALGQWVMPDVSVVG